MLRISGEILKPVQRALTASNKLSWRQREKGKVFEKYIYSIIGWFRKICQNLSQILEIVLETYFSE